MMKDTLDDSLSMEWIEANGLGGWASSTVAGAHTRRYHGLLVAATKPPVGRVVLLSKLDETLVIGTERIELGTNCYPGTVHPDGWTRLESFTKDPFPTFVFSAGGVRLRKSIAAVHGENTTVVLYEVLDAPAPVVLELRPLVAGRDYHAVGRANPFLDPAATFEDGELRTRPYDGGPELHLGAGGASYAAGGDWYYRFEYAIEKERGLDFHEDLFNHGTLAVTLAPGARWGVIASTATTAGRDPVRLVEAERARRAKLVEGIPAGDPLRRALTLAADAFLVRRGEDGRTIIAGYPWFTDWGRDTMIALPGLCLSTGRLDEARKILRAFARASSEGMLPNRFPDQGEAPEFNTVDATLWFFVAVRAYLDAGGDADFVLEEVLPVLRDVVAWHDRGTRYGIRVDEDGLLRAGVPGVQLTWMDAKVGDWVVTPRHGKAVEINALWINALSILGDLEKRAGDAAAAKALAARVKAAKARFEEVFWNDDAGCLYDVVDGDRKDAAIRPNQVFALSLPVGLLPKEKARQVLETIESRLLTPRGLRSLDPAHPDYKPVYRGGPAERDAAYHQGTVWSWLLGPYVDALVAVRGAAGRKQARQILEGFRSHLDEAGLGTVSEIFDADAPHAPRGCFAQAWSVGEILRGWVAVGTEAEIAPKKATSTAKRPYKIVKGKTKSAEPRA